MLRVSNVRKSISDRVLFKDVNLVVGPTSRIGMVGPNGAGKSLLLRLMAGLDSPDEGAVSLSKGVRLWYQPQGQPSTGTVADALGLGSWLHLLQDPLSEAHAAAFEAAGGTGRLVSAQKLVDYPLDTVLATLSGGQTAHLAAVAALLSEATLLLLDEPSNNLDEERRRWLMRRLTARAGAMVVASHDRELLDAVTEQTLVIDPQQQTVALHAGNYSWTRQRLQEKEAAQGQAYREQEVRRKRLEASIQQVKSRAASVENATVHDFWRARAKKVAALGKARETRLERMLSHDNRIEKPRQEERIRLQLDGRCLHHARLLMAQGLDVGYGQERVLRDVNVELSGSLRVWLRGPNGSGKTTLLNTFRGPLEPQAGMLQRRPDLVWAWLDQGLLFPAESFVLDWFRNQISVPMTEGEVRTFLHRFLFTREEVFKPIRVLSHGERMRLWLAACMAAEPDILVLDEPTNHVDMSTVACLEQALCQFQGALVLVTHDRVLARNVQPHQVWNIEQRTVRVTPC